MLDLFRAGEVIAPGRTNEEEIMLLQKQKAEIGKTEIPPTSAAAAGDVIATPVTVK